MTCTVPARPSQLSLLLDLPARRPLIPLEAVMVLTDRDEDEILTLIEQGRLEFAWDIRHPKAERREIRIWRESLRAYKDGGFNLDTEEAAIDQVLPHDRPEIKSTELKRVFSCGSFHIMNLIRAGELRGLNEPGVGPNGFVRVSRSSVIEFLMKRRVR